MRQWQVIVLLLILSSTARPASAAEPTSNSPGVWKVGTPIVTYWAGPSMTDETARQMADGGFNLVWCTEKELDVAL